MKTRKKCVVALCGEGNSGKSVFAAVCCTLRGPYGTAEGLDNINNNFPFESIKDCSSVLIDDIDTISTKFISRVKSLTGGSGGAYCPVKGKQAVWVQSMPMFFTSNNPTLFETADPVWNSRCHLYKLDTLPAEFWEGHPEISSKKVHPMALAELFIRYKLMPDWRVNNVTN